MNILHDDVDPHGKPDCEHTLPDTSVEEAAIIDVDTKPLSKSQLKAKRAAERKVQLKKERLKAVVKRDARIMSREVKQSGTVNQEKLVHLSEKHADMYKRYGLGKNTETSDDEPVHWGEVHLASIDIYNLLNHHRSMVVEAYGVKKLLGEKGRLDAEPHFLHLLDVQGRDIEELAKRWSILAESISGREGYVTADDIYLQLSKFMEFDELMEEITALLTDRSLELGFEMAGARDRAMANDTESVVDANVSVDAPADAPDVTEEKNDD